MTNLEKAELELVKLFEPGAYRLPAFLMTRDEFFEISAVIAKLLQGADYVDFIKIQRFAKRIFLQGVPTLSIKPLLLMSVILSVPAEKYAKQGLHRLSAAVRLTKQFERQSTQLWESVGPDLQVYTDENIKLWEWYCNEMRGVLYPPPCNTGVNSNGDGV